MPDQRFAPSRISLPPEPSSDAAAAARTDAIAAAERIRKVVATMREHGIKAGICDEVEGLASTVLAESPLGDPNDRRAHKLTELLHSLERRIDRMLGEATQAMEAAVARAPEMAEQPRQSGGGQHLVTKPMPRPTHERPAALGAMSPAERIALFS